MQLYKHGMMALLVLVTASAVHAQQHVGIGTAEPVSMLTVARGIHIDLDNINNFALESAITFGNDKLTGIGSQRLAGNNTNGIDLYTGGTRRVSVTSNGLVGIGTSLPTNRLTVNGNANFLSNTGLGISDPLYPLHTSIGYVSTRLGIGAIPSNSTYALRVGGSTLLEGNTRNTGYLIIEDYLRVNNDKGIVRSNNSTQYKIIPFSISGASIASFGHGETVTTGVYNFPEAFGSTPRVIVSHLASGNFTGTGNPYAFWALPREVTSTGCKFEFVYFGSGTLSATNITFSCMAIGPE